MADGIIDFIEFAISVTFALPVALLGMILFSNGDTVGGVGFLVVAVGMVAFDRYVVAPRDLATGFLTGLVGKVVKTPDDERE